MSGVRSRRAMGMVRTREDEHNNASGASALACTTSSMGSAQCALRLLRRELLDALGEEPRPSEPKESLEKLHERSLTDVHRELGSLHTVSRLEVRVSSVTVPPTDENDVVVSPGAERASIGTQTFARTEVCGPKQRSVPTRDIGHPSYTAPDRRLARSAR